MQRAAFDKVSLLARDWRHGSLRAIALEGLSGVLPHPHRHRRATDLPARRRKHGRDPLLDRPRTWIGTSGKRGPMNEIDARSLQQKLAAPNPPLSSTLRTLRKLAVGRIEGSVNIPMNELPSRIAELPEGREVVTVCQKGIRSFNAAGWLRQWAAAPPACRAESISGRRSVCR